jgi:hypothetical protein
MTYGQPTITNSRVPFRRPGRPLNGYSLSRSIAARIASSSARAASLCARRDGRDEPVDHAAEELSRGCSGSSRPGEALPRCLQILENDFVLDNVTGLCGANALLNCFEELHLRIQVTYDRLLNQPRCGADPATSPAYRASRQSHRPTGSTSPLPSSPPVVAYCIAGNAMWFHVVRKPLAGDSVVRDAPGACPRGCIPGLCCRRVPPPATPAAVGTRYSPRVGVFTLSPSGRGHHRQCQRRVGHD